MTSSDSLADFLFVRRFRRLRLRLMASAQAGGVYTAEDLSRACREAPA